MTAHLRTPVGEGDHTAGPATAPITLVEYGDFECGHCGRAFLIVEEVRRQMGDKLRFVFRHFPLTEMHPHALHAAESTESVNAQVGDKGFWAMHHAIYKHQQAMDDNSLAKYATAAGADASTTLEQLESDQWVERVQHDFSGGVRSGVNGTPSFFINGTRFDGDWSDVDSFIEAVNSAAD
jgi:protein-disulfide isomerase